MNIQDLIKAQFSANACTDTMYKSKRPSTKYIAKPYTLCGEVNKHFYAHYIPFKKEIREKP